MAKKVIKLVEKEETKDDVEIKKEEIKEKKKAELIPKIHLVKYLSNKDFSKGIRNLLHVRFGTIMLTETEWEKAIDKELKRRIK